MTRRSPFRSFKTNPEIIRLPTASALAAHPESPVPTGPSVDYSRETTPRGPGLVSSSAMNQQGPHER
jgi:hypothetical protein